MKFSADWRIIRWDSVRKVANNDLTRIIGLIPLAGYLILFNDELARIVSFNTIAGAGNEIASPFILGSLAKMRFVFFGSLFVLLSYIIFKIFSPPELDYSNGDLEFSAHVRDRYGVHDIANMEIQVISDSWKPRTEAHWNVLGKFQPKKPLVSGYRPDARSHMFSKHSDYIHFLAREWWTGKMHTFRGARVASMFLGISGYIMLAIPTLDIAQAVMIDVVTSFE